MDWPEVRKHSGLSFVQRALSINGDSEKANAVIDAGMVRELLIAFRQRTNCWAKRIIFYRAGISEEQVLHQEMDVIKEAVASLEERYQPTVTSASVLGSETNSVKQSVKQESFNHTNLELYLIGRTHLIFGKQTEAQYSVLHDENNFTAEEIQCISSELCRITVQDANEAVCLFIQLHYKLSTCLVHLPCIPCCLPSNLCLVAPVLHAYFAACRRISDTGAFDHKGTFDGQGKGSIKHVEVLQRAEAQTCNLTLVSSSSWLSEKKKR